MIKEKQLSNEICQGENSMDGQLLDVDGIQVLYTHNDSPITSIHFCVAVGSSHETDANRGISHFLEHCMFLGSDKITKAQYWDHADRIGAKLNAHTSYDHTQFHLTCPTSSFEKSFELLSDLFLHVKFPEDEFEKERAVVLDEIRRYDDDPEAYMQKFMYNKSCDFPILGTSDHIKDMKLSDVKQWRDEHYRGKNVLISVVGNITLPELKTVIWKYWKDFNRSGERNIRSDKGLFHSGFDLFYKEGIGQTYYSYNIPCYNKDHTDYSTMLLVNQIFGGSMSSRLGKRIREELGLVYGIYSSILSYDFFNVIEVNTSSDNKNFPLIHSEVLKIVSDIMKGDITQDELDLVKISYVSSLDHASETSSNINMRMTTNYLFGRGEYFKNSRELLNAVTVDDCNNVDPYVAMMNGEKK